MVQVSNDRSEDTTSERLRRRAEARRHSILRAAARVFRRHGYAASGMREIAREADLSPGNLYHYFNGKHEILYFCQDRSLDRMLDAVRQARLSRAPAVSQLRAVLRAHVLCMLDELEGAAAHLEVESLPDELRENIIRKRDRYERSVRRLVAAGMRREATEAHDAGLVTRAMLGAMNWSARWFRPEGPRSAATVADALVDYLVGALAPARGNGGGSTPDHDSAGRNRRAGTRRGGAK